jgi:hypothetical protein
LRRGVHRFQPVSATSITSNFGICKKAG